MGSGLEARACPRRSPISPKDLPVPRAVQTAGHQRVLSGLLRDAQRGKFQAVLVWAVDRLSREGGLAILSLVRRFKSCGVRVLSYWESWTEAPGELAELLFAFTGWVARMESQRRSERTKAGLARVRAQGKKLGRPRGSKDKRKHRRRGPDPGTTFL